MAFFNKRMILLFTNLFLLTGIGTTIANYSTSVLEGQAIDYTLGINTGYSGPSDGSAVWTTSSSQTLTFGGKTLLQSLNATTSYISSITSTSKFYPAGSTYGTAGKFKVGTSSAGGWGLSFTLSNSKKAINVELTVKRFTSNGSTYDADTYISINSSNSQLVSSNTSELLTFNISSNNSVSISGTGKRFYLEGIKLSIDPSEDEASNFSSTFLNSTENKTNCTSDIGWSALESDYNALTIDAQNEFKTNSTNQTIIDARARYNYLISYNNSLNDFVFGV
jgi:hypothetical protein